MSLSEYRENAALLETAVSRRAFIRNVRFHRNADGSFDLAGNKRLWNEAMKPFRKTKLWEQTPGFDDRDPLQEEPYLVFVPAPEGSRVKTTILVSHGGGFQSRTGCEGANVAWHFHRAGYPTAILSYRLDPYSRLDCLADIQRAVRVLRAKREEFGINGKLVVMGFSAGGMLSGNCATLGQPERPEVNDEIERCSSLPDACVVGYGAMSGVSFPGEFMADRSQPDLFGRDPKERYLLAPEKHISPDTCPFFIWQTLSDDGRHGLTLAKALEDAGVPYELHILEGGVHGLALADGENDLDADIPHIAHWSELCLEWLKLHDL